MKKEKQPMGGQMTLEEIFEEKKKPLRWWLPWVALALVGVMVVQLLRAPDERTMERVEWREFVAYEDGEVVFQSLNRDLQEAVVALHAQMLSEMRGEEFDPLWDVARASSFLTAIERPYEEEQEEDETFDDFIDHVVQELFDQRVLSARDRLDELNVNNGIAYFALYENMRISSGNEMIEQLMNDEGLQRWQIWDLEHVFAHVIVVQYNSRGQWDVPFLLTPETIYRVIDYFDAYDWYDDWYDNRLHVNEANIPGMSSLYYQFDVDGLNDDLFDWQNPQNMTFVFGIPHEVINNLALYQERTFVEEFYEWHIHPHVFGAQSAVLGLMIVMAIFIPLSKIKGSDKGYERIRQFPIELVALATFMTFVFVDRNTWQVVNNITTFGNPASDWVFSSQNMHLIYYLGWLFLTLSLLGYLIHYMKDIISHDGKTLKKDSLVFKGIDYASTVDLKNDQSLKVFMLISGQIFVALFLLVFGYALAELGLGVFFVIVYAIIASTYVQHKMKKIRQDYLDLREMTKKLAAGNLEVPAPVGLENFETLAADLSTIQEGLTHATQKAVANERMKGELITNVSHDLKTPLTSIITYVDLLRVDDLEEAKRQQYLDTLVVKTDRLKTLVEDLFEISKASTGNMTLDMMEVDVVTLMKQTLLGLEDRIVASGLTLKEGYPEEPVRLELDGARMHRVFENLIINIVKYAMPGTRAYIDIIDGILQVDIILRNISAHELSLDMMDLAERFVRGDEARNTEGSGLGLAIAKSFVELQGGSFEIVIDGDLFKVMMTFEK